MTIHELFEQHYAEQNDTTAEIVRACRMVNGSYNNLPIARAFRMFRAGFELNYGDKMSFVGFLSDKGLIAASAGLAAGFQKSRSKNAPHAMYVKQCEPLKPEVK